mgnify:CR=1 FL=1
MKGVVDLFFAKDKITIFWFLVFCGTIVVCAWQLNKTVREVRAQPQYVYLASPDSWYLSPTVEFEDATALHAQQTRLAAETMMNRGPSNVDSPERLQRLFTGEALEFIRQDLQVRSERYQLEQIHQKVEVGRTNVLKRVGQSRSITEATGQVIIVGVANGQAFNEVHEFYARFYWERNPDVRYNARFPTICERVMYQLNKKSET